MFFLTGLLVGDAIGRDRAAENRVGQYSQQQQIERAYAEVRAAKQEAAAARADTQAALAAQRAEAAARAVPVAVTIPMPPVATTPSQVISSVPSPIVPGIELEVVAAHIVNESDPEMQMHQIISVPEGAHVKLRGGSLEAGLGIPYQDYIEVEYNGKIGKISRFVVKIAT